MPGSRSYIWAILWLAVLLGGPGRLFAGADKNTCDVCGEPLGPTIYFFTDKVTGEVKRLCYSCSVLPTVCYVCGVPVKNDYKVLPDGRVICARDAKSVVLDGDEGKEIADDVEDKLNRLFSRFITFPTTNVTFGLIDRINIAELFKVAGNDYTCPDVWGYYRPNTNGDGSLNHLTFVLLGLPRSMFRDTFAHELTHAWERDNVSEARRKTMSRDSYEAFCELVAYKLADEEHDEIAKRQILLNQYTRGQINVFITADQRYGFNDMVDWMKYGLGDHLDADDLDNVHRIALPGGSPVTVPAYLSQATAPPAPGPEGLVLGGIMWSKTRPMATINGQLFAVDDSARIPMGVTNRLVHCLSIGQDEVKVRLMDSGEIQILKFKRN